MELSFSPLASCSETASSLLLVPTHAQSLSLTEIGRLLVLEREMDGHTSNGEKTAHAAAPSAGQGQQPKMQPQLHVYMRH